MELLKQEVDLQIAKNFLLRRKLKLILDNSSVRVADILNTVLGWLDEGAPDINGQCSYFRTVCGTVR